MKMNRKQLLGILGIAVVGVSYGIHKSNNLKNKKLNLLRSEILKTNRIVINSEEYLKHIELFKDLDLNINFLISEDFRKGRVIDVNGWQLSKVECYRIVILNL
jgi:hypothetical protein